MSFDTAIDDLANKLAKKASEKDTPIADMAEAMKVLNTYYALKLKHNPESDDEGETIGGMIRNINASENTNGSTGVSKRLRHRADS